MSAAHLLEATPPATDDISVLREAAAGCQACPLWERGTQTVFGAGPQHARLMLVGEQPGDVEDETGLPFVGPAGQVLDRAMAEAGIERESAYVTNAVKHFKWEPRGKRRIHSKPSGAEVRACKPWLLAELESVQPEALVLLGATAAQSLLGADFRVTRERGRWIETPFAPGVLATIHPSAVLRAPDAAAREEAMAGFTRDLHMVAERLGAGRRG